MSSLPQEAKFLKPTNFNGIVKERKTTRISPLNGSVFGNPGAIDRINFNIPTQSNYAIDMNTLMVHFQAELSGVSNDIVVYFNNSVESVIDELIIKKGTSGVYLEDIKQYNYLDSIFTNLASAQYNSCVGKALLGIGSPIERVRWQNAVSSSADQNTIASVTGRLKKRYCVPLRLSGISNYGGILPTHIVDSVNAFSIEIILAHASNCLQAFDLSASDVGKADTTARYTLSNVYLTYDIVRMDDSYYDGLNASLNAGIPIEIPYKTWRTSTFSWATGNLNVAFNINESFKSLNSIYVAFFAQNEQNDYRIAGRDRLHFPNLKSYQLQINNMYYPMQPVVCEDSAPEAFLELLKSLGDGFLNSEYSGPFDFDGREYTAPAVSFNNGAAGSLVGKQVDLLSTSAVAGSQWLGTTAQPVQTVGSVAATDPNARDFMYNAASRTPTNFILGFNLRKLMNVDEEEMVGENLSEGSGIMTLRLEALSVPTNYNVLVCCNHDAVFRIEANQSSQRLE